MLAWQNTSFLGDTFSRIISSWWSLTIDYKEPLELFSVGHLEQITPCIIAYCRLAVVQEQAQTEEN